MDGDLDAAFCEKGVKAAVMATLSDIGITESDTFASPQKQFTWELPTKKTQLRAFHVRAANQETQMQTVDQDMGDAEADQGMADVAVVTSSRR